MSDANGYSLSRSFWDFSFENPHKMKPIHSAIYFFAIEHCNRLGWKKHFGFPSQMVMEAVGVKNWRTYSSGLNDLVEFGFIEMIETSKNQYSSNIIAIVNYTKASTKALDKALQKHSTKHSQSTVRGTVSIDKQRTIEQLNKETSKPLEVYPSFLDFWNLYDKKTDSKDKCENKWKGLSQKVKEKIMAHLPNYIHSTPDKKFRKNPMTYLNNEGWEHEIIITNGRETKQASEYLRQHDPDFKNY